MYCIVDDAISTYVTIFNVNPVPGSIPVLTKMTSPGRTSPNPRHLAVGWLSGLRVRECVLCTYSYAGGRLADWLAPLRVRACVRCRCRFY